MYASYFPDSDELFRQQTYELCIDSSQVQEGMSAMHWTLDYLWWIPIYLCMLALHNHCFSNK